MQAGKVTLKEEEMKLREAVEMTEETRPEDAWQRRRYL